METNTIFKGLKVMDLSTVLAGPSVGSFFAELGADVLKIENPKHPDITRDWKLPTEDRAENVSAYFSSVNYKKQYRNLDYTTEEGRGQLLNRVAEADLVLMNFKYGLQDKLGLNDEVLRENNPQLIIGKINGYGQEVDRPAYDLILQAESGFMAMNGTPESGPVKMPVALVDVLAAHHLREGILIELLQKAIHSDYKGKTVTVALYEAAVSSLVNQASNYLMAHHNPQRIGSLHPNIAPYGEIFRTKDQKLVTFAIGSDIHFKKLCNFLGRMDWAENSKYKVVQERIKHRKELYALLLPLIAKIDAETLFMEMRKSGIPCGEIKDLKAVFQQSAARNMIREENIEGKMTQRVTGIAFKID